jgi:hypothetical protein
VSYDHWKTTEPPSPYEDECTCVYAHGERFWRDPDCPVHGDDEPDYGEEPDLNAPDKYERAEQMARWQRELKR